MIRMTEAGRLLVFEDETLCQGEKIGLGWKSGLGVWFNGRMEKKEIVDFWLRGAEDAWEILETLMSA